MVGGRLYNISIPPFLHIAPDLAIHQCNDPFPKQIHKLLCMGCHANGSTMAVYLSEQMQNIPNRVLVQVRGQLIQNQNGRAVDNRAGQFHPAALPIG